VSEYALYIGIAAGVCTSISMLPQLVKIIKTKKADDISYGMVVVLLVGVAAWIWYGVLRSDYPIIVTNSFSLLVNMLVLVFSLRYKKNRS
jgi:MtN3 and saliva related transmembrane protein